ncbi:hypothetical protein AAKU55_002907 [Oxalobacteraceae bacterium GrIS 1.11]
MSLYIHMLVATLAGAAQEGLTWRLHQPDTGNAPKKEGAGFSSSNKKAHERRNAVFFRVLAFVRLPWAAVAGKPSGLPVPSCRSANPTICRPPRLAAGRGSTAQEGGITMPCTTTSPQSRLTIIKHLADQTNALYGMLSIIGLLEPSHQHDALLTCSAIADDVAHDLDAFVQVAA